MAGRKSLDVGKDSERRVVAYFHLRGMAGVERAVRTGFRASNGRVMDDAGDLTGLPGVCVQVKSLRPANAAERQTRTWLAETEQQRAQSGASVGLLVVRRWGTTDVGRWWCFLHLRDLFGMSDGYSGQLLGGGLAVAAAPVRMELSDVVDMMQAWGWAPAEQEQGTR
jgi:hypothetical protein